MNRLFLFSITALFFISAAVNVGLGRIVLKQRGAERAHIAATSLLVGTRMPELQVHDLDNKPVQINYVDAKVATVVYIFSPHCGFCRKNAGNIAALAAQVSDRYRIIGVSTEEEDLEQFIAKEGIRFPVYTRLAGNVARDFKAGGTPQTFVIDREGKLIKVFTGAYSGKLQQSVEGFFQAKLPGFPRSSS